MPRAPAGSDHGPDAHLHGERRSGTERLQRLRSSGHGSASGPAGDPLSVTVSSPARGSLSLSLSLGANGSFTYTPAHGYLGADSFTYTVTDTTGDYAAGTVDLNVVVIHTPAPQSKPRAKGTAKVGRALSCSTGTWTGSPTFSLQWSRNGTPIPGATSASYKVQKLDEGSTLTCVVTATNLGGSA
ncbi:MAG: Ig-like domain-containing protein, partial [Trebonia sp.]